jgi:hypothetical protein
MPMVTPPHGAKPVERSAACHCGQVLPAPRSTGRPRLTCSTACRRGRDYLLRRLRRRDEWLDLWRAEEARRGYPRARVREELRQLRAEREDLRRELRGGHPEPARHAS